HGAERAVRLAAVAGAPKQRGVGRKRAAQEVGLIGGAKRVGSVGARGKGLVFFGPPGTPLPSRDPRGRERDLLSESRRRQEGLVCGSGAENERGQGQRAALDAHFRR